MIEEGSPAGHAAILARALGLPALGGARGMLEAVEDGDEAMLDADEGQLILRPEPRCRRPTTARIEARRERRARAGRRCATCPARDRGRHADPAAC